MVPKLILSQCHFCARCAYGVAGDEVDAGAIQVQRLYVSVENDKSKDVEMVRESVIRGDAVRGSFDLNCLDRCAMERDQVVSGVFDRRRSLNMELEEPHLDQQFAESSGQDEWRKFVCHDVWYEP